MTPTEATKALERIREDAHACYPANGPRLRQLDHALDTASMAFEHLADEDVRERELRSRLKEPKNHVDRERHAHQVRGGANSLFEENS